MVDDMFNYRINYEHDETTTNDLCMAISIFAINNIMKGCNPPTATPLCQPRSLSVLMSACQSVPATVHYTKLKATEWSE